MFACRLLLLDVGDGVVHLLLLLALLHVNSSFARSLASPTLNANNAAEDSLPPFSKGSTNLFDQLVNGTSQPLNETQNLFQSSISCGQSEFYVQINFNKPFRGLVYAYRTPVVEETPLYGALYYPVEVLDSCTLQGNGATVVYLQLSFLSECIEKLSLQAAPLLSQEELSGISLAQVAPPSNLSDPIVHSGATAPAASVEPSLPIYASDLSSGLSKYNLDGFNFRRALNDQGGESALNSSNIAELYQLSLYIQNDPAIEQKSDSKVTIQCTALATKNIIFEQNLAKNYTSRRVDQQTSSPPSGRTIVPSVHLTIFERKVDPNDTQSSASELIDSRIDILRGRIPFLKLIESPVNIGDDVTLIIRAKELDGLDTKVSTCYAHDNEGTKRFALTDDEGCPLEPSIMSEFHVTHNLGTATKVYHSTLAAFKFPNSGHLHIDCTLLTCRGLCPKVSCETPGRHRMADGS